MPVAYQTAAEPYVRDIWFDGNEEIVEIGATCPNQSCRHPIVSSFTRPRITRKTQQCRRCGTSMIIVRPAFGFEASADPRRDG